MVDWNASLRRFVSGHTILLLLDAFLTTIGTLLVKTEEFGLNKATGLGKRAPEFIVLVSDGLDRLRVSNCEVCM